MYHLSTGDLFRDLAKANSDTSIRVQKILKEGGLPFDDLAATLWMHAMSYNLKENQGFILDGAPRRVNEAQTLDRYLDFLERKETTFNLLIDISRQEAFDRLSKRRICKECGRLIPWVGQFKELKVCDKCAGELITRSDDSPEAIKSRLDYYDNRVAKVVEFYQTQNRLIKVNGEQSIEDVFKEILEKIK